MKKVAIFGKPGSGKSTVSKALAKKTGLPLYSLDSIVYKPNGEFIAREVFDKAHTQLMNSEHWIVDGLGPIGVFYQRLKAADTLVYIDLPYAVSYWFVTKRLIKGLLVKPEGWPEGSSLFQGTLNSYKMLRRSPEFWNDEFMTKLIDCGRGKRIHVITTVAELNEFVATLR